MAVNKPFGDNSRVGAVRDRVQVFNPRTKLWVKIDTNSNRIMDVKTSGGKFKGVRSVKKRR